MVGVWPGAVWHALTMVGAGRARGMRTTQALSLRGAVWPGARMMVSGAVWHALTMVGCGLGAVCPGAV